MTTLQPIARWKDHGVILADKQRLYYRPDSRPQEVEPWPESGATLVEKIRRLMGMHGDLEPVSVEAKQAVEFLQTQCRAREAAQAAETKRVVAAAEVERVRIDILKQEVEPRTTGWKKVMVSCQTNAGRMDTQGYACPMGVFAVHKSVSTTMWTLTHMPSGNACAHGSQKDLRILAVRLLLIGYGPGTQEPTEAIMFLWARIAIPFRRTGDPWCAEEDVKKKEAKK